MTQSQMKPILRITGWREIETRHYIQRRNEAMRDRNLMAELVVGECIRHLMQLEVSR